MKILNTQEMRYLDAYTIAHEPIASLDLMERAAIQCTSWLIQHFNKTFHVVCGPGNNGGDGLAIARLLHEAGFRVHVYILKMATPCSDDCQSNQKRLRQTTIPITEWYEGDDVLSHPLDRASDVVIDALFGSGLNRPLSDWIKSITDWMNRSTCCIVSIDMPSGLLCEGNAIDAIRYSVKAHYTLTFGTPKLSFLLPSTSACVGEWVVLDIGLHPQGLANSDVLHYLIEKDDITQRLRQRKQHSHKGTYGHALLIAGSLGKIGAAVLSASACMRAGAGLLTSHIPRCGYDILQTTVPEAMVQVDSAEHYIADTVDVTPYNAIGIGPGLGTGKPTQTVFKSLLRQVSAPLVIDADAINILAAHPAWISDLPKHTILTPHFKEFERLVGVAQDDDDRHAMQKDFAMKHGVFLILKGAYSAIACPDGTVYFNSTGNPGMATGGSGDVLTGVLTGLLAQGYPPKDACILGVYLHGLAGDFAAKVMGQEALIASDIVQYLGAAFQDMQP